MSYLVFEASCCIVREDVGHSVRSGLFRAGGSDRRRERIDHHGSSDAARHRHRRSDPEHRHTARRPAHSRAPFNRPLLTPAGLLERLAGARPLQAVFRQSRGPEATISQTNRPFWSKF